MIAEHTKIMKHPVRLRLPHAVTAKIMTVQRLLLHVDEFKGRVIILAKARVQRVNLGGEFVPFPQHSPPNESAKSCHAFVHVQPFQPPQLDGNIIRDPCTHKTVMRTPL